jgi:hypothetical protein
MIEPLLLTTSAPAAVDTGVIWVMLGMTRTFGEVRLNMARRWQNNSSQRCSLVTIEVCARLDPKHKDGDNWTYMALRGPEVVLGSTLGYMYF